MTQSALALSSQPSALSPRPLMNGKPVYEVPAKSVINFNSGFGHKLLCDSLTFSAGSACAYSCTFCYVEDLMRKSPHLQMVREQFSHEMRKPSDGASRDAATPGVEAQPEPSGSERVQSRTLEHSDIIIRRRGVRQALRDQLTARGQPKFADPNDQRVIYASPLVDVAANMELVEETVECCKVILELTHWQIRLLSKSNLLQYVAQKLDGWRPASFGQYKPFVPARKRIIYGVSTGTLDDKLAGAFEQRTALVSKRLASLHWLQDNGFRTYGMICPSLPQRDYPKFAREMAAAIRAEKCEHVWAEIMNVRGESMTRTTAALRAAGYAWEATELEHVAADKVAWEQYARQTFEAHAAVYGTQPSALSPQPSPKLRFLQYVTKDSRDWWKQRELMGAILL